MIFPRLAAANLLPERQLSLRHNQSLFPGPMKKLVARTLPPLVLLATE